MEAEFKQWSFDVKFHDVQGKNYRFTSPRLNQEIVPEKSKVLVKPTRVVIMLFKASKGNWLDLQFKEDKVITYNGNIWYLVPYFHKITQSDLYLFLQPFSSWSQIWIKNEILWLELWIWWRWAAFFSCCTLTWRHLHKQNVFSMAVIMSKCLHFFFLLQICRICTRKVTTKWSEQLQKLGQMLDLVKQLILWRDIPK